PRGRSTPPTRGGTRAPPVPWRAGRRRPAPRGGRRTWRGRWGGAAGCSWSGSAEGAAVHAAQHPTTGTPPGHRPSVLQISLACTRRVASGREGPLVGRHRVLGQQPVERRAGGGGRPPATPAHGAG